MADKDNPLYFAAEVDFDSLDDALSKAEKGYLSMSKQVEKATKSFDTQSNAWNEIAKLVKRATGLEQEREKQAKRTEEESDKLAEKEKTRYKKLKNFFQKERSALSDLGVSWSTLGSIIGGAAVIGIVGKLIKDYLSFDRLLRSTSVTLGEQPKLYDAAGASIQRLTGYLDISREELVDIAKQIGELKLIKENTQAGAKAFQSLMKDTIHLGKAMDVSTSSVVDLYDTFTRVYKLPHRRLRDIASSMKFIQESTSISGEELMSFAKNLDDVLTQMTGASKTAKSETTKDLLAMAGAFKDAGLDPNLISGMFSEALNVDSEQGQQWLAFITRNTQYGMDRMREIIEKGDVVTPMELFIKQMKKDGPEALKWNRQFYQEMTGMNFAQLTKVMQMDENAVADLIERRKKAMKQQDYLAKRAQRVQNGLSRLWNEMKRAFEGLWLAIGQKVTEFVSEHAPAIIKAITSWVDWITSPAGGERIKGFFASIGRIGSKAFKMLGQIWDKYFKDKVEWLLTPQGGKALEKWFTSAVDTIGKMADGIAGVAKVISDIKESLKTDEQRALEYEHARESQFEGMRGSFEKMITAQLKAGGTFKFGKLEMKAMQSNIKPFMGKVAHLKLAEFTRDIERAYPHLDPDMKAKLVRSYGETLLSQVALGYGPLGTGRRATGTLGELEKPEFKSMMPGGPSMELKPATARPASTTVTTPKVTPRVVMPKATPAAPPAATSVRVQPDRTGHSILASIDDKLGRIEHRGSKPQKTVQQQLADEPLMP